MPLNSTNYTPYPKAKDLFDAISAPEPDLKKITELVTTFGVENTMDGTHFITPLQVSIIQGKLSVVELLVNELKANVNNKGSHPYSPLGYAIRDNVYADGKIPVFLINKGAETTISELTSLSALREPYRSLITSLDNLQTISNSKYRVTHELSLATGLEKLGATEASIKYYRLAYSHDAAETLKQSQMTEAAFLLKIFMGEKEEKDAIEKLEKHVAENNNLEPQLRFDAYIALARAHLTDKVLTKSFQYYSDAALIQDAKKESLLEQFCKTFFQDKDYYNLEKPGILDYQPFSQWEKLVPLIKAGCDDAKRYLPHFVMVGNFYHHSALQVLYLCDTHNLTFDAEFKAKSEQLKTQYKTYFEALKERQNPRRSIISLQKVIDETAEWDVWGKTSAKFFLADAAMRLVYSAEHEKTIQEYQQLTLALCKELVGKLENSYKNIISHLNYLLLKLVAKTNDSQLQIAALNLMIDFYHKNQSSHVIPNLIYLLSVKPSEHLQFSLASCYNCHTDKESLLKSISHLEKVSDKSQSTPKIIGLRKRIAALPGLPEAEKLSHLQQASAAGDPEASRLLTELKLKSKEVKQHEVTSMISGALQQACERKDTREIARIVTQAIEQIKTTVIDDLDQFILTNVMPGFVYTFFANDPTSLGTLYTQAKLFLGLKRKTSDEITHFFNWFLYLNNGDFDFIKPSAFKGFPLALASVFQKYKDIGTTYRQRAQIILKTCLLLINPKNNLELSRSFTNAITDTQSEARTDLEAISEKKADYPPSSKEFAYRRLATACLMLINELNGKTVANPAAYLIHKLKADESDYGKKIYADLVHGLKDAFDVSEKAINEELATKPIESPLETTIAALPARKLESKEESKSDFLPLLDLDHQYEEQMPIPARLLLYTAHLLKHLDRKKIEESVYYKYLLKIQNDACYKAMSQFAQWCLIQIKPHSLSQAQAKPLGFLFEKALMDTNVIEAAFEAQRFLNEASINIDTPRKLEAPKHVIADVKAAAYPSLATTTTAEPKAFTEFNKPIGQDPLPLQTGQLYPSFPPASAPPAYAPMVVLSPVVPPQPLVERKEVKKVEAPKVPDPMLDFLTQAFTNPTPIVVKEEKKPENPLELWTPSKQTIQSAPVNGTDPFGEFYQWLSEDRRKQLPSIEVDPQQEQKKSEEDLLAFLAGNLSSTAQVIKSAGLNTSSIGVAPKEIKAPEAKPAEPAPLAQTQVKATKDAEPAKALMLA